MLEETGDQGAAFLAVLGACGVCVCMRVCMCVCVSVYFIAKLLLATTLDGEPTQLL